jgi:transcriptional regulator with XRE-family HTH domain
MEREDGRDMTTAELLARLGRNPAFVAAWDLEAPKVVVAANVSRLRHRRGMTQRQLAEAAGMRQPRIAEIESGLANPQIETLARIAHALEVDLSVLHRPNDATHASVPFAARRVPSHAARTSRRAAPPTDLA